MAFVNTQGAGVFDTGRDENNFATPRGFDVTLVFDGASFALGVEGVAASDEISVFDIEGGRDKSRGVDPCTSTKCNAIGIDQKNFAVAFPLLISA